jgi:hypothetical protein
MAMKRSDRKSSSDENAANHPTSRQSEPVSYHELKQFLASAKADRTEAQKQRDEFQQLAQEKEQQVEQTHHLYLEEQQKHQTVFALYQEEQQKSQTALTLYQEEQQKYQTTLTQYQEAQSQTRSYLIQYEEARTQATSYFTQYQEAETQAQSYLGLYQAEKTRGDELMIRFESVQGERDRYLTLYNESQEDLKFERRSKAGIKGWETRRKKENQRLKQEISEMTVLLRDSFERKDAAVSNLYVLAERMDRIQQLVDSVDETSTASPMGVIQKFQRIWQTVREILAE